ncbi:replication restart helicase PriA [Anaerosacchariphilus polymeriproducens]|uniref:Replication restart protein PriA n=1 Tax=Anaerosacchariphilus polymeriproducens TaxID=1812858 RepID=A0A371AXL3_9FIRM|nr:primosomal protein N' [Anaerosacchariphilus polymeriproducens]RDU24325.1 primosomal protein N' [Anaerosacchariphilus polymeriproducens]
MQAKYANVIIDIVHSDLDKTFQYKIPEYLLEKIQLGMEVVVPFGKSNRLIKGYVIMITDKPEFEITKIKEIYEINYNSLLIESKQIQLAGWIKENYGSTMIQSLKTVIPIKQKVKSKEKKIVILILQEELAKEKLELFKNKHYTAKARLLEALLKDTTVSYEVIVKKLKIAQSVIKSFEQENMIRIETESFYRNPVKKIVKQEKSVALNTDQSGVVEGIWKDYTKGIRNTYLIHGVTGSGKTEVYMELIQRVIQEGKQAIVLIPEISLTFQTVTRFYQRFGDRVSIMNSRLSAGEKYDQMMRARNNDIDIMIGPRSALFTPFQNLGLIIIDEEHESSYKSESMPRYHARETAIQWAKMLHASVVLGSATPSIDSYYRANTGEYVLYQLSSRVQKRELSKVYTIDLREELREGNRSILSMKLQELIEEKLQKQQQIMLFINRRGFAGFISCRSCGHVMKCPHCDVSLTVHNNGQLVCHYCGYQEKEVSKCPNCGSPYIGGFKAGTQKIESIVKSRYPNARILRMDMDTTKTKEGHERILKAFANHEADILIGTQMIVKGHDFPNVTLVGILAADLSLHTADYRASEKTFQLLTQAAGRAGRGEEKGEVVIQTYTPDHYSIVAAAKQDYKDFYQQEILFRSLMSYPPAANMMVIMITSLKYEMAQNCADILKTEIEQIIQEKKEKEQSGNMQIIQVIGPADAVIAKVNDRYQKVIYIKAEQYDELIHIKDRLENIVELQEQKKSVNIQFDFNPMNFM